MAANTTGGSAFCEATVTVDTVAQVDVIDWSSSLGCDILRNHADGRAYGQHGCTHNHTAVITFTTLNLGAFETTGTPGGILAGDTFNTIALTVNNYGGGSVTHTLGAGTGEVMCQSANATGGHGRLGELQMAFDVAGRGGDEPTVSWAYTAGV